jgi:RNA polymerase sigma-70 factor (ECF subfamily)
MTKDIIYFPRIYRIITAVALICYTKGCMKSTLVTTESKERALLARLLNKDELAVREFYTTYSAGLLRFIRVRIENEQDVEEIAQDTLFAFLDGARDFTGKCKLGTYLCSIAKNKIIDFYRKKKIKRIVFSQLPNGLESLIATEVSPEELYDRVVVKEKIRRVFAQLTPAYAQTLTMKYIEGRSVEEIAELLVCSFKSAESILFRARKAFVKLYIGEGV